MVILFVILIVLACIVLGLVVLVQNPKGGGLSSSIGGVSNQFMGVKQTTDILEKGTWIFATLVALLCLFSAAFIPGQATNKNTLLDKINTRPAATALPPAAPQPVAPVNNGK